MPIHDWTRVTAGTFHDVHTAWIAEARRALNGGLLPEGYYALVGQCHQLPGDGSGSAGVAVAEAPPRVAFSDSISEAMLLAARRGRLVIRHSTGDRIVALLEIVSPGNKEKRGAVDPFVDTAVGALEEGYHLLAIDLFPPGAFDPHGMHGAIWARLGGSFELPPGKPLTLAAYAAGQASGGAVTCYVEPTAVGSGLIDMPLFLDPGHYVNVPLELTYQAAYEGVPRRWKRVIEGVG